MQDIILTSAIDSGLDTITLSNTNKLFNGLFLYGNGIYSGTKIISVVDSLTIQVNIKPYLTGNYSLTFSDLTPAMYQQRCEAMREVSYNINLIGQFVEFVARDETNIIRDSYSSIKQKDELHRLRLKVYPLDKTPTTLKLEKAGLRELSDVIFTTSSLDWTNLGYTFDNIDIKRWTVKIDGQTYEIKEKSQSSQFGNVFLNYNFGVFKK